MVPTGLFMYYLSHDIVLYVHVRVDGSKWVVLLKEVQCLYYFDTVLYVKMIGF